MNAPIQFPGQADGWSRRRAKKAARLARLAPWMKGLVLETGAMVEALQTLLEPGDAVALEGDNQKQADFLSRSLVQVDPAKIHDLHGEAAVAEIHAEIIALRRHVPVIGVITGMVGCFGGMSITAGLCSYLAIFPQARLELNGPEVIEQEAGIDELDASDKHLIWSLMGGEQRYETGFADALVEDDAELLKQTIRDLAARGIPARHRSEKVEEYRRSLANIDPAAPPDGPALRRMWPKGDMQ